MIDCKKCVNIATKSVTASACVHPSRGDGHVCAVMTARWEQPERVQQRTVEIVMTCSFNEMCGQHLCSEKLCGEARCSKKTVPK